MAKALSQAKVAELDRNLHRLHDRVHSLIDIGPKRKRVTASFLTETCEELRLILVALDNLALSPFIGVEVDGGRRMKEPKRLDGERPMPPNLTIEDEMKRAMSEGTEG